MAVRGARALPPSVTSAERAIDRVGVAAPIVLVLGGAGVLVAVVWPLGLLLLAAVATAIVARGAPASALGVLAASIPLQDLADQRLGPVEVRWTSAVLLGLGAGWLLRLVAAGRRPRLAWSEAAFLAYVLVLVASIVAAESLPAWGGEVYRWSAALLVLGIAVDVGRGVGTARPVLAGMAVGVGGASLVGAYQVAAAAGPASFEVGGLTRAYATFGQPNPFAGYLELTVPSLLAVAAAWLLPRSRATTRAVFGGRLLLGCGTAALLGSVGLVLTQSRGGWLGALAGLGAVGWLTGGARWVAVGLLLAALVALVVAPVGGRVVTGAGNAFGALDGEARITPRNFAAQERLAHWRAAVAMVRARPWFGVGAGNFDRRFAEFSSSARFRVSRGHAHSGYLQAAAQAGMLGLVSYLALLVTVGARLVRVLRGAGEGATRPLVVGAIGATMALAVHGLFEYVHVLSLGLQLSLVWALAESGRGEAVVVPGPLGTVGA